MTVEEAIRARVASLSAVTAIAGARVYLDTLPQGVTYPAVLVQLVDDPDRYHLRGPEGLCRARVQVDAYVHEESGVDAYAVVAELAAAINGDGLGRSASGISGWAGGVGSPPFEVTGCLRLDRMRRYDPEELRVLSMRQDYYVWYRRP